MELPDLLRPADMPTSHEDLRKGSRPALAADQRLELPPVSRVHRNIPLVDGDAEAAEDCADGAAVLVRPADAAERSGVEDDAGIGCGGGDDGIVAGEVLQERAGR